METLKALRENDMDDAITGDAELDDIVNEGVDDYDKSQKVGQQYIRNSWKLLKEETQTCLVTSNCYNQKGQRLEVEYGEAEDIEELEYHIGKLKQSADCKLPSRTEEGAMIEGGALSDDVLMACDHLLFYPQWHDPSFLRLAMRAFRTHKLANLMTRLPAIKEAKYWLVKPTLLILYGILGFLLMLASPYFIAIALTSAAQGNEGVAASALYVVGAAVFILAHQKNLTKDIGKPINGNEVEYNEWYRLNDYQAGSWLTTGAGAKFYFEEMARKGVNVPPVAIDLCAALETSVFKQSMCHRGNGDIQ